MTSIKKAAILIATHNKAGVLNKCLEEISHVKGRELFDIFIIDNNSSDQNKRVTDNYKDINYLKEDKNYFASRALNDGFSKFRLDQYYKYLFIMAHDVRVDKNTFYELLKMMESNSSIGMLGASHYEYNTSILRTIGHNISSFTSLLINFIDNSQNNNYNHFSSLFVTTTKLYKETLGFDSVLFPMIYEEPDYGERVLKKGYQIRCCVEAKIWHPIELETTNQNKIQVREERIYSNLAKTYLFFRNRILYMSLYAGFFRFLIFYLVFNPIIFLYYFMKVRSELKIYAIKGFIDGSIFATTKNKEYIKRQNTSILNI